MVTSVCIAFGKLETDSIVILKRLCSDVCPMQTYMSLSNRIWTIALQYNPICLYKTRNTEIRPDWTAPQIWIHDPKLQAKRPLLATSAVLIESGRPKSVSRCIGFKQPRQVNSTFSQRTFHDMTMFRFSCIFVVASQTYFFKTAAVTFFSCPTACTSSFSS